MKFVSKKKMDTIIGCLENACRGIRQEGFWVNDVKRTKQSIAAAQDGNRSHSQEISLQKMRHHTEPSVPH